MKIEIDRQSVCAADDQSNSLEIVLDLPDDCSLRDLVDAIEKSKFLQFSSSHAAIIGSTDGSAIVRIFCPFFSTQKNDTFFLRLLL